MSAARRADEIAPVIFAQPPLASVGTLVILDFAVVESEDDPSSFLGSDLAAEA
jgi:hypothetical protein